MSYHFDKFLKLNNYKNRTKWTEKMRDKNNKF